MSYDFLKNDKHKVVSESEQSNEIEQETDYIEEEQDSFLFSGYSNNDDSLYKSDYPEIKLEQRSIELDDKGYHKRLLELNLNAESKHYVLFFGLPASGKSFIIGSLIHYMKNGLGGTVYLDDKKSTDMEKQLFMQLLSAFSEGKKFNRTSTGEYFEFHLHFTPKDPKKSPLNIILVDASGEDSKIVVVDKGNKESGELPSYLRAILESDVNTKIAFVYDKFLPNVEDKPSQVTVLDQIFNKIQYLQRRNKKYYPKILLLAKSDKIEAEDKATVEKYNYSSTQYAKGIIPTFANGFFNENPENKSIFYKMGIFSLTDDILLKFEEKCPAKLFKWLYRESIQEELENPPTCWQRFLSWFKGE